MSRALLLDKVLPMHLHFRIKLKLEFLKAMEQGFCKVGHYLFSMINLIEVSSQISKIISYYST